MSLISRQRFANAPTPMAGLALGISSLGWCWENAFTLNGHGQQIGAGLAGLLLLALVVKFIFHPNLLLQDLAHPVVGSVVPTFAMASMVVSKAVGGPVGSVIWLVAVILHIAFLVTFIGHRMKQFELHHMVPSWFVPPVGIIVAVVASPGGVFTPLTYWLLGFGIVCYAIMLPMMLYRLIFVGDVPDAAKPTIAILAAPGSLSLAGYLTLVSSPSPLLVYLLLGMSVLMTMVIYLSLIRLLRLPFSPGYAAFTFPLVISATALYKTSHLLSTWGVPSAAAQLHVLAGIELAVATVVVSYVASRYFIAFNPFRVAPLATR